jgi:myo-inositol 2-dehydrogenase / D-chiro-inositol 1-dehydrogenase
MTVRVGVIGAGIMGADHAKTLHRMVSGAEVVLVADVDLARAQEVTATIPGSRATTDGFALIADDGVDAIIIASHDSTHAALAIAAVRAGKPVLCEKPLAPTLAECVEVVRAERAAIGESGVPLISLGFMRRFDPGYVELKAAIGENVCGTTLLIHNISRGVSSAPGATDESSVTGSAIHEFDVVPWLLDSPITEVSWNAARSSAQAQGFRDPHLMLLRTADGVLSTVEVFLNARYGYDVRCEIVGEEGTLALTEPAKTILDRSRGRTVGYAADWRPRFAEAYRLELQAWIDAVTVGTPAPLATAQDGLVANAVAEAVIASMRNGGSTVSVEVPTI